MQPVGPVAVFIRKVLLKLSQSNSFSMGRGCFPATMSGWSSCYRDHMACTVENICYLTFAEVENNYDSEK